MTKGRCYVSPQETRSFAIVLGFYNGIPAVIGGDAIRAMLVTACAKDRYYVQSYFLLHVDSLQWIGTWNKHNFCIGGVKKQM